MMTGDVCCVPQGIKDVEERTEGAMTHYVKLAGLTERLRANVRSLHTCRAFYQSYACTKASPHQPSATDWEEETSQWLLTELSVKCKYQMKCPAELAASAHSPCLRSLFCRARAIKLFTKQGSDIGSFCIQY